MPAGTARLLGLVVHDPTYRDPDAAARAAWIGDGTCPGQVMADHAADLARYDAGRQRHVARRGAGGRARARESVNNVPGR